MAYNVPTVNNFKLPTLNNNPPPSRQFSRDKMLLKKPSLVECLLNKLLNLNRGFLSPWSYIIFPKLVILMTKQKSSKANLQMHYFMLKMLKKAMYLDFSDLGQVTKI